MLTTCNDTTTKITCQEGEKKERNAEDLVSITIDSQGYEEKPDRYTGQIKNRMSKPECNRKLNMKDIGELIVKGYTFFPAIFNGHSVAGEDWSYQQIFALDIDKGGTMEEVYRVLEENGVLPCFMYHTFSSTPENVRFRVVFCADRVIDDGETVDKIQYILMNLIPCSDRRCSDRARIFYGGKGTLEYTDFGARINPEDVISRLGELAYKPHASTGEKETKKAVPKKIKEEKVVDTWNLDAANERMERYVEESEDTAPLGKGFIVKHNMRLFSERSDQYFMENERRFKDGDGRHMKLVCSYSMHRACEDMRTAISALICINDTFLEPLGVKELFRVIDAVERAVPYDRNKENMRRGYYFSVEGIINSCDIENAEDYGIGVDLARKKRVKENKEIRNRRDRRIEDLMGMGLSRREIVKRLKKEGFKISLGTLQTRLYKLGIIQKKEVNDEMER